MLAGFWRQHEMDIYSIHDLIEINRVLDVQEENKRLAAEAAQRERENLAR